MQLAHITHGQDTGWWCGPASVYTVIGGTVSEAQLAQEMGTQPDGGTSRDRVRQALTAHTGITYHDQALSWHGDTSPATPEQAGTMRQRLAATITAGHMTIINVHRGAADLAGGWHQYDGGHYVVACGWDRDRDAVLIMDPAISRDYWMFLPALATWAHGRGYLYTQEDDMDQSEPVKGHLAVPGRKVGDVLADLSNLRDWLYAPPGAETSNPPPAGSRAALLFGPGTPAQPAELVVTDEAGLAERLAAIERKLDRLIAGEAAQAAALEG